jgi:hypothetical protein
MEKLPVSSIKNGQGVVEYVLILMGIILAVIFSLRLFGVNLQETYCKIAGDMGGEGCEGCSSSFSASAELGDWEGKDIEKYFSIEKGQACLTRGGISVLNSCSESLADSNFVANLEGVTLTSQGKSKSGFDFMFRAQDEKNGYQFFYDAKYNTIGFLKLVKGKSIYLALEEVPADWALQELNIQVKVVSDLFIAYRDGEKILQAKDDAYTQGKYGLGVEPSSQVCVDEMSVQQIP